MFISKEELRSIQNGFQNMREEVRKLNSTVGLGLFNHNHYTLASRVGVLESQNEYLVRLVANLIKFQGLEVIPETPEKYPNVRKKVTIRARSTK